MKRGLKRFSLSKPPRSNVPGIDSDRVLFATKPEERFVTDSSDTVIPPKKDIAERAHIGSLDEYQRLYRQSLDEPESFWSKQAERLTWFHSWNGLFVVTTVGR